MSHSLASSKSEQIIRAVVHRANGDVEDHGIVSYWHKNPLMRWTWKIRRALGLLK